MTEKFDDGTSIKGNFAGPHYSEKGGHLLRGLSRRIEREAAKLLGLQIHPLTPPIRIETSWYMRRHMRRISVDGRR